MKSEKGALPFLARLARLDPGSSLPRPRRLGKELSEQACLDKGEKYIRTQTEGNLKTVGYVALLVRAWDHAHVMRISCAYYAHIMRSGQFPSYP